MNCGGSGADLIRAKPCWLVSPRRALVAEQLAEISRMINAENSDLFDVLAYIAFALAPITGRNGLKLERATFYPATMKSCRRF